jgi:hypothetical protein
MGYSIDIDFLEKKRVDIMAITEERKFVQLVDAYLLRDKAVSNLDERQFLEVAGLIGFESADNPYDLNKIAAFCRILRVLGIVKEGRIDPGSELRAVGIWMMHNASANRVVGEVRRITERKYCH